MSVVLKYPKKNWDYAALSRRRFAFKLFTKLSEGGDVYPDLDLELILLSSPIDLDLIDDNKNNKFLTTLSRYPELYSVLSVNPFITCTTIIKRLDKPWSFQYLSYNQFKLDLDYRTSYILTIQYLYRRRKVEINRKRMEASSILLYYLGIPGVIFIVSGYL